MLKTPLGFQNFGTPYPLRNIHILTLSICLTNTYFKMSTIAVVVGTIILTKYGLTGVLGFTTELLNEVTGPKSDKK